MMSSETNRNKNVTYLIAHFQWLDNKAHDKEMVDASLENYRYGNWQTIYLSLYEYMTLWVYITL